MLFCRRMTDGRPVLVVEDHADTRHMVEEYLTFQGIPTIGAVNGLEGLSALREHRPCLILLDLSMPVMDGWRFREEQRRLPNAELAGVPVMVLSALTDCEAIGRALGAIEVIPKPIDFERLLRVVRDFCERAKGPG
jgi:CheY-like chemotaxis protein